MFRYIRVVSLVFATVLMISGGTYAQDDTFARFSTIYPELGNVNLNNQYTYGTDISVSYPDGWTLIEEAIPLLNKGDVNIRLVEPELLGWEVGMSGGEAVVQAVQEVGRTFDFEQDAVIIDFVPDRESFLVEQVNEGGVLTALIVQFQDGRWGVADVRSPQPLAGQDFAQVLAIGGSWNYQAAGDAANDAAPSGDEMVAEEQSGQPQTRIVIEENEDGLDTIGYGIGGQEFVFRLAQNWVVRQNTPRILLGTGSDIFENYKRWQDVPPALTGNQMIMVVGTPDAFNIELDPANVDPEEIVTRAFRQLRNRLTDTYQVTRRAGFFEEDLADNPNQWATALDSDLVDAAIFVKQFPPQQDNNYLVVVMLIADGALQDQANRMLRIMNSAEMR